MVFRNIMTVFSQLINQETFFGNFTSTGLILVNLGINH